MSKRIAALVVTVCCVLVAFPSDASNAGVTMKENGSPTFYYFTPVYRIITVGDTVTWTNSTTTGHTVTGYADNPDAAQHPIESSPQTNNSCQPEGIPPQPKDCIAPGTSWPHTFDKPGKYYYFCKVHADSNKKPSIKGHNAQNQPCGMCGVIDVRTPSTPGPAPTHRKTTSPHPTPSVSPSASLTGTPGATPSTGPGGSTSPGSSPVAAPSNGPTGGSSSGGRALLALGAIVVLGGAGYWTWRRFLASR